jgi:hypothetical protein
MSSSRRHFLVAAGSAATVSLAGCNTLSTTAADVNPNTGLAGDPSAHLDGTPVALAGDADALPAPPTEVAAIADADAVLATASADAATLAGALRDGKTVAFARSGAQTALGDVLARVRDDYRYGRETVRAQTVDPAVAVPRGDTIETYTFVREDGWDDPILDGLGWALGGRLPDCRTFVPEHAAEDDYSPAGAAHVVGRLPSGETYATRTAASVAEQNGERFLRLRATLHAAANDGYAIEEGVRELDLPDDQHIHSMYPNPHTEGGVQVRNESDSTRSTFRVTFTPKTDRARGALTGCGGFRTEGSVAYDHLTSVTWLDDRLLGADRHHGGGTGRGEWHVRA